MIFISQLNCGICLLGFPLVMLMRCHESWRVAVLFPFFFFRYNEQIHFEKAYLDDSRLLCWLAVQRTATEAKMLKQLKKS